MPLFSKPDDRASDSDGLESPEANGNGNGASHHDGPPPDEHTRLLPNRVDSAPYRDGGGGGGRSSGSNFLAPDDPAVSPYNLWSIRALRTLTVGFTLATLVWWILLLVAMFVTPPGFQTRGSGFLAYGYASLALANLVFTLVFFGVPAKTVRLLAVFMSVSVYRCWTVERVLRYLTGQ